MAFGGWSDGGDSATTAAQYLIERHGGERIAEIDMEDFLDLTVVRPMVRSRGAEREIVWPDHRFYRADIGGPPIVVGVGDEPHLRWKSYAREFVALVRAAGFSRVIFLGAFLADVIYSQPTRVGLSSSDPALVAELDIRPPRYEGPTGILSVLAPCLRAAGISQLTLWAQIPHYVSTQPNPRGALALLERVEQVSELRFDLERLRELAGEFDATVSDLIANDPQLQAYVRELKRRAFST